MRASRLGVTLIRSRIAYPLGSFSGDWPVRFVVLGLLACPHLAFAQDDVRTFVDDRCGVSFQYPSNWTVQADSTEPSRCLFSIRPSAWDSLLIAADSVDVYTLTVEVVPEPFESVAAGRGFERRDGEWVVLGRQAMEAPAQLIEGPRWQHGVRGARVGGCYRLAGAYGGICELPAAVIGGDDTSASLDAGPQSGDVLDLILATFEFVG